MNQQVAAALIGAVVATLGWIVTYWLQQHAKRREERRAFLHRQVEEFYSPLLALVQQKIYVQDVQDRRMATVPGGPDWVRALRFFQDKHIVPTLEKIAAILRTKSYLSVDWPSSFDAFLEHEAKSVALYQLWRDTDIPGDIQTIPWPGSLENDIKVRKATLESELRSLHGNGSGRPF